MNIKIITTILFTIFCSPTFCQTTHADPKDYPEMYKRTLVVELLEENPIIAKHLEKRIKKHPDAVNDYKNFIKLYNNNIQLAIDKFWTLNRKVEFKTTTEIDKLKAEKNGSYVALYYSESSEHFIDYNTKENLVIPTLNYSRMEMGEKHVDYSFYLPVSFLRPHDSYIESDLIFAIHFIQNNIEYMVNKDKKMNATHFAKNFESNPTALKTKTLLIDNNFIHDTAAVQEVKNNYTYPFNIVSAERINEAVETSNGDFAYLVNMPYEMPSVSSTGAAAQVLCMRLIVDAKNGNILSILGSHIKESNSNLFLSQDFVK